MNNFQVTINRPWAIYLRGNLLTRTMTSGRAGKIVRAYVDKGVDVAALVIKFAPMDGAK